MDDNTVSEPKEELEITDVAKPEQKSENNKTEVAEAKPEANVETQTAKAPKSGKRILGLFVALIVVLLVFGGGGVAGAWAITYSDFTIGYPLIEKRVSDYVQSLSFTPKTLDFLLDRMIKSQKKVSKHSFDLSFAAKSDDIATALGLSAFEMQIKGDIDYTDIDEERVKFSIEAALSEDYTLDARTEDGEKFYLKLNKIPSFVCGFIPCPDLEPIVTQWMFIDTKPLNTDAKEYLNENTEDTKLQQEFTQQLEEFYEDEKIQELIEQSEDDIDGVGTYRISFTADPETIDYIGEKLAEIASENQTRDFYAVPNNSIEQEKLSDVLKKLKFDMWIEKGTYRLKRISGVVDVIPDPRYTSGLIKPEVSTFSYSVKFDNYGKDFEVNIPDTAVTFEDMMIQIQKVLYSPEALESGGVYSTNQFANARDTQRKSDLYSITNTIYQYSAENGGNFPTDNNGNPIPAAPQQLGTAGFDLSAKLVPTYIPSMPVDPSESCTPGLTCYWIQLDSNQRIIVSADSELDPGNKITVTR